MGLSVMILGLVLFLGVHTLTTQRALRARLIASTGEVPGSLITSSTSLGDSQSASIATSASDSAPSSARCNGTALRT